METKAHSDARERVLNVAEQLFAEHGYNGVTLRDVAGQLGIRQASLYHHVPGGKEELFVEVMERMMERRAAALDAVIAGAEPQLGAKLRAAARWMVAQPPMELRRFAQTDLRAVAPEAATRLRTTAYRSLFEPLIAIFRAGVAKGEIRDLDAGVLAGLFLSMVSSVPIGAEYSQIGKEALADVVVDVVLNGIRR